MQRVRRYEGDDPFNWGLMTEESFALQWCFSFTFGFVVAFPFFPSPLARQTETMMKHGDPALAHLTTLSTRYLAALRLTHSHSSSRSHSPSHSHSDSVCDSYFNYFLCDFCFCYSAARHIPICVFIFTFIPIQCLSCLLLLFCFGCRDSLFEITNAPSGAG